MARLIDPGNRTQQRVGVGVPRVVKESFGCRTLNQTPRVHHRYLIATASGHAEVMGNENHRHASVLTKLVKQIKQMLLNSHINRGGGLIGDEQRRFAGQRHGDHHTLTQPS